MRVTPELLRLLGSEPIFDDEPTPARPPADEPLSPVVDPGGLPYVLSVEQAAAVLATSPSYIHLLVGAKAEAARTLERWYARAGPTNDAKAGGE